ncbi:RsiV family protein [Aquimarina sp. 2-A2]|uniref:RsiV family protein n=1 Tax=Aquimarina sp. 2-A2 TaxID=3382644 RepID=UPI00387EFDB5
MEKIIFIATITLLLSCKSEFNDTRLGSLDQINNRVATADKHAKTESGEWSGKKDQVIGNNFLSTKKFYAAESSLILDYKYPHLDERYNPLFSNFNSFIQENYLKTDKSIQQVLQNDELSCDPLYQNAERRRRNIDYKIYTKNDRFLSILLYKTNYYEDEHHNSFMFKGLNYDLKKGAFLTYNNLFKNNSEDFLLFKLNQELQARIRGQDSFYDCWELTQDKFEEFKSNFVIESTNIKFYFNDCTVCPTYSGNYFLEIPLEELSQILKSKNLEISSYKS